jgi:molecular chaperone DnaJ
MNREWVDKDFYQTLGVSKDATSEQIKHAYRKLAQKHHPDANPGDTKAEERFKDVAEAYGVLSNPEQRKEYDEVRRLVASGGYGGGGPFAGGQRVRVEDVGGLFGGLGDLFGFGNGSRQRGPRRGIDTTADLTLSFNDAIEGVTTTVSVRGEAPCSRCGGNGAEPGTSVNTCPTCGGTGSVAQNQGMFSFAQTCPQCGGSGRVVSTPCAQCRGRGRETRTRNIKVRIPAGINDGATVRLAGKGGPGADGGPPGDLLVKVHVTPHPVFGRRGDDLTIDVPVSYTEATLGTAVEIPTLDGTVSIRVPAGTPTGKVFRIKGRGVKPERGPAGDLYAKVEVVVPRKVSREEKKLLEQLAEHETDDHRAHLKVSP